MEAGGKRQAPAALPPGKTRYPLYRRLGGPQGRSGRVRKISPPTGIRSPDRPTLSESLYRLSYPDPFPLCVPYSINFYNNWERAGCIVSKSDTVLTKTPLNVMGEGQWICSQQICVAIRIQLKGKCRVTDISDNRKSPTWLSTDHTRTVSVSQILEDRGVRRITLHATMDAWLLKPKAYWLLSA